MKKQALLFVIFSFVLSVGTASTEDKKLSPEATQWLQWKSAAEKNYSEPHSPPAITHHIYLEKKGDQAFLQLDKAYPRFTKEACPTCLWEVTRTGDKKATLVNIKTKSKTELLLDEVTPLPSNPQLLLKPALYPGDPKMRVFVLDMSQKDLERKRKRTFFAYDYNSRFPGKFNWQGTKKTVKIQRSDGSSKDAEIAANITFYYNGLPTILNIYKFDDDTNFKERNLALLMFRDSSSGHETYGAGRFLNMNFDKPIKDLKNGDAVTVDFNYSYNPPCAVSTGFHCPLAQDIVNGKILAGEQYYNKKGDH